MKYERIRGRFLPLFKLLKTKQRALSLTVPQFFFCKSFLLFLCCFSFCQVVYAEKNPVLDNNQFRVNEIRAISDPNERAIEWLTFIYLECVKSPDILNSQLNTAQSLWNDDYIFKEAIILLTKVEIDKIIGNYDNIIDNSYKAIKIIDSKSSLSISEKKLLVLAYTTYARISKYTKDKNGLNYAYQALELANKINYPAGKVFAHNQIGLIIGYFKKNYQLSLEHFHKAEKLLPQLPPNIYKNTSGFIVGNIAKAWSDLGDIEKSIQYKLKVLADEKNKDNIELLLGTNNNLGSNYYEQNQYELAEKYLQITLDLIDKHKIYTNQGIPLLRMGLIKLEQGNRIKAAAYADAIDFWLINHKFVGDYKVLFYQFKSKISKINNDYEQAIYWLEKANIEQKSTNLIATSDNLVKLEEKEKHREIRQELRLLKTEKKLNQATINSQKILLISIGFIMILSIWFGITFYEKNKEVTEAYDYILSKKEEQNVSSYPPIKSNHNRDYPSGGQTKHINEILKQKILRALYVNKSYLSPDLTLKKFADQIDSNTSYVSKTINDGFGKNFNALINEYRIEEVLRLFHEGQHQTFTIESIYQKAGFKSKSSFQKAFKAKTGVTATHYINHIT